MEYIILPFAIVISIIFVGVLGTLVRTLIFKEEGVGRSFSSNLKTIIIGILTLIILGTAFKGCNSEQSEEMWKKE